MSYSFQAPEFLIPFINMQSLVKSNNLQPPAYNDFLLFPTWLQYFLLDYNNKMNAMNNDFNVKVNQNTI